jgi:hypothetical protein
MKRFMTGQRRGKANNRTDDQGSPLHLHLAVRQRIPSFRQAACRIRVSLNANVNTPLDPWALVGAYETASGPGAFAPG